MNIETDRKGKRIDRSPMLTPFQPNKRQAIYFSPSPTASPPHKTDIEMLRDYACPICHEDLSYIQSSYFRQDHVERCVEELSAGSFLAFESCVFCGEVLTKLNLKSRGLHYNSCLDNLAHGSQACTSLLSQLEICICCYDAFGEATLCDKAIHLKECSKRQSLNLQQLLHEFQLIKWDSSPRTASFSQLNNVAEASEITDLSLDELEDSLVPVGQENKDGTEQVFNEGHLLPEPAELARSLPSDSLERYDSNLIDAEESHQRLLEHVRQLLLETLHDKELLCRKLYELNNQEWDQEEISFLNDFFSEMQIREADLREVFEEYKSEQNANHTVSKLFHMDDRFMKAFSMLRILYGPSAAVSSLPTPDKEAKTIAEDAQKTAEVTLTNHCLSKSDTVSDPHSDSFSTIDLTNTPSETDDLVADDLIDVLSISALSSHEEDAQGIIDDWLLDDNFDALLLQDNFIGKQVPQERNSEKVETSLPESTDIVDSGMPDYECLTISELKNALCKYGFKPSDRDDMISMLQDVWRQVHTVHQGSSIATANDSNNDGKVGLVEDTNCHKVLQEASLV